MLIKLKMVITSVKISDYLSNGLCVGSWDMNYGPKNRILWVNGQTA